MDIKKQREMFEESFFDVVKDVIRVLDKKYNQEGVGPHEILCALVTVIDTFLNICEKDFDKEKIYPSLLASIFRIIEKHDLHKYVGDSNELIQRIYKQSSDKIP